MGGTGGSRRMYAHSPGVRSTLGYRVDALRIENSGKSGIIPVRGVARPSPYDRWNSHCPAAGFCRLSSSPLARTQIRLRTSSGGRQLFSRDRILLLCRLHETYQPLAFRAFIVRARLVAFPAECHPYWPTAVGAFGPHSCHLGLAGWVRSRGRRLAGVACLVQSPFTRAGYVSAGHGRVIRLGSL